MKIFVLCFVAALCVIQATDAFESINTLRAKVQYLKSRVEQEVNTLDRIRKNAKFDLDSKIFLGKMDQLTAVNDIINPAISEIRSAGEAAKKAGKDRDDCVESGRLSLKSVSTEGYDAVKKCASDAVNQIDSVVSNAAAAIQNGKSLITEIDMIFLNCYSSNILAMQNCIIGKLPSATFSVDNFESTAKNIARAKDSVTLSAMNQAARCYPGAIGSVRTKAAEAKANALRCINN